MDDLDRHIAETEKANPGFTSLVEAAQQRRADERAKPKQRDLLRANQSLRREAEKSQK